MKTNCVKFLILALFGIVGITFAQKNTTVVKFEKPIVQEQWSGHNIGMELVKDGETPVMKLTAQEEPGLIWMNDYKLTNGTIELDVKGSSEPGKSFVGVAFNFVDEDKYEAVYFRPFNFKSGDESKRKHSVQYISEPSYTWKVLREQHPGKYENSVNPVPDPDEFFHVKIVINQPEVKVFVDGSSDASLVLKQLSNTEGGSIGLWVDYHSVAYFKNLTITKE